ncbi:MAG TPA: hypothetical protein VGM31_00820 [Puia sp.]
MLQGKYARKVAAATFMALMLTNMMSPSIAFALTSGPTQPEATSFEPVDTTDMVNVQTGDMTYNVPLLEVPGPEGSYPLSLSYHAGIQPNEDASWVGLGWTLNPGAVTRNVNGFPDDWYNPTTTSHVYWSGGSTTTVSVGINVGIANTPATVGAGLSFSQDTYQGFGLGEYASVGGQFGPLNASLTVGVSPYGGAYASAGLSAGLKIAGNKNGSLNASFGISATTNFKSLEAGFTSGIGFSRANPSDPYHPLSASVLGATISTGGDKPTMEIGGLTASVSNSKANNISTTTHGLHVDIPVWYGVNVSLGFSKQRYSINEKVSVVSHGSLYSSGWQVLDDVAYDEYALLEDPAVKNIIDYPDPTKVQGGAFPEFDVYNVNAQGIGGNMRPYLFQSGILNQNIKNSTTPLVTYFQPGVTSNAPFFRFENDFSNSYRQTYAPYANAALDLRSVAPPFDPTPLHGYHDASGDDGNTGYAGGNNLAGSKHVDVGVKIHPTGILGYNNPVRLSSYMIEGFSITNESGVTYHFGLPAYSYGEERYQEAIKHNGDGTVNGFNRDTRTAPYAYTWYLTTITGPDFVDRNGNGFADDGDWGYWANFEYGKWADNYIWRSPSEGFNRDEDSRFQDCTLGHKEIYYLNAIRTRSNVALFEKDVRADAKGEGSIAFDKNGGNTTDYAHAGIFDNTSTPTMMLTHIYLLKSGDENIVGPSSGTLNANVLDATDVAAVGRSNIEARALRIIDFGYDYSTCPKTSNSFTTVGQLLGKLTLQSLATRGKGGATLLPSTRFQYDLGSDAVTQSGVSITGASGSNPAFFSTTNGNFTKGDMITSTTLGLYCGVITDRSLSSGVYTYTLRNCAYTGGATSVTVFTTKNPPYNKDAYDNWGLYKSDFDLTKIGQNENLYRTTSVTSSKGTDAWSLRGVTTSLGSQIKINYEPDQFSSVGVTNNYPFTFQVAYPENMTYTSNMYNIYFKLDAFDYNISDFFNVGGTGQVVLGNGYSPDIILTGNFDATMKTSYKINQIDGDGTIHVTLTDPIPLRVTDPYSGTFVAVNPGSISPTVTNTTLYGGGIRVNQLSLVNTTTGNMTSTVYQYSKPGTTQSSGATSYLPGVMDVNPYIQDPNSYPANRNYNNYSRVLYKNESYLYALARVLPPPGVLYEYVTVTKQSKNTDEAAPWTIEGSTQYQFEVFRPNMAGIRDVTARTGPLTSSGVPVSSRNVALQRFTGCIGNLRRMITFDAVGAKISETINHYLHDGLENMTFDQFMPAYNALLSKYYYQGFLQERYSEVKQVQNQSTSTDNGVLATLSAKEDYPCIQTGQTVINYVNGARTTSQNLSFDFYSGAVTQSLETDAYGNNFLTQTIPAYRAYSQPGTINTMGLKINNGNNSNMLTQVAGSYTYRVDASNTKLGLVAAKADIWSSSASVMAADGSLHIQDGRIETVGSNFYPNGNVWRTQAS